MLRDDLAFIDQLRSLAKIDNPEVVQDTLQGVHPEDLADAFTRLELEEQLAVLQQLETTTAADVMVALPTETARALVSELPDETVAIYLDILPMDDALDLREEMDPDRFEALLEVIPPEDAQEIRRLMAYPEDSVGRLATEKFFEVGPDASMADILADIRRAPEDKYETVNDIYVLNEGRHLLGVMSLRKVLRSALERTAREVMREEVVTVNTHDPAEDAARSMSRYGYYALPVLDYRGRMIGIFTGDDAQEILRAADSEDVLKLGGVSGDAEAYLSLSVAQIVKRRLPWLMILFVAEFFTGTVLRHYMLHEDSAAQSSDPRLVAISKLALFVPLIIGAGGNSGSQVTTTITRALAVGEIRTKDAFKIWSRELAIAAVIGASLGLVGWGRALMWGNPLDFSLVIALALPSIVMWAASVGSLLPLAAKRLRIDPAVMSAPFIATFVDATGLIIYFEIASRVLGIHF